MTAFAFSPDHPARVALLHGAGYAGGELIRLFANHPSAVLAAVTSRSAAGRPVDAVHGALRGTTDLVFTAPDAFDPAGFDAVILAAEHGQSAAAVQRLLATDYDGVVVDLSADFRFAAPDAYERWFRFTHPAPDLLGRFVYGLPELFAPYPPDTRYVANPGCFATGVTLALWPLLQHVPRLTAHVTALTGASGSGTRPKETTHYPTRDGNVRAYKVLEHQHLPEILQSLGGEVDLAFVPVSGPWTRGIWGTAHVALPEGCGADAVAGWFETAYRDAPFVRTTAGALPEMRHVVGTPFCDVGWVVREGHLVVGFALDNLLKGAAAQAVQNVNLLLGLPETAGLLPPRRALAPA